MPCNWPLPATQLFYIFIWRYSPFLSLLSQEGVKKPHVPEKVGSWHTHRICVWRQTWALLEAAALLILFSTANQNLCSTSNRPMRRSHSGGKVATSKLEVCGRCALVLIPFSAADSVSPREQPTPLKSTLTAGKAGALGIWEAAFHKDN